MIKQAVALISKSGAIGDVAVYEKGIFKREEESTTGIGEGLAIPHCKNDCVTKPALAAMVIPGGVEYEAPDGEPVQLLGSVGAVMIGRVSPLICASEEGRHTIPYD